MILLSIAIIIIVLDPMKFTEWIVPCFVCVYIVLDGIITRLHCLLQEGFGLSSSHGLRGRRSRRDMILPVV